MREKIYYIKTPTHSKTIHIKGFCNGSFFTAGKDEDFYALNDVYKEYGNTVHMCRDCEAEKEAILQGAYAHKLEETTK